ncbi:hypothetical protein GC096_02005 [Paenibacillus sp. LMG 31461]|uniref:Uncharacterized protein n=1 Tax=Paenibacillus plantarum TaxID=2654975 RepID=A0ABX1X3W7_9BACL|nr:hypothetical protein [Paenibacillus plantarum]NOU62821.1 hypothetical protein [Paenibacillus plantarum]
MDELITNVEKSIHTLNLNIERNKKYYDYPFTNNCDHFYRLNQMHKQLECWNHFLEMLRKFKNDRCCILMKESSVFEKKINVERKTVPGFVTHTTLQEMIEYMRKLEWKVDGMNGIWKEEEAS